MKDQDVKDAKGVAAADDPRAILRFSGISAQKMRQVADMVRGKDVDVALHTLRFITKVSARPMEKLITSAVANAREKANAADARFDADAFFVKTVMVDEGPTAKRFRPRAQGRAYRIRKRSCHVHLVLGEHAGMVAKQRPKRGAAKAAAPVETKGKKASAGAKAAPKKAAAKAAPKKAAEKKKTEKKKAGAAK